MRTIRVTAQHAAVRCDADERQRLEQLCRYVTRPALANERVQINSAGQVVLKLKTAWPGGTTHIVMSPLEFMQRLAALVPRPSQAARTAGQPASVGPGCSSGCLRLTRSTARTALGSSGSLRPFSNRR